MRGRRGNSEVSFHVNVLAAVKRTTAMQMENLSMSSVHEISVAVFMLPYVIRAMFTEHRASVINDNRETIGRNRSRSDLSEHRHSEDRFLLFYWCPALRNLLSLTLELPLKVRMIQKKTTYMPTRITFFFAKMTCVLSSYALQ